MKLDLFGDDFPDAFDKQEVEDGMALVYKNQRPASDDINRLARIFVCLKECVADGIYDGRYLYVIDTNMDATDVYSDVVLFLSHYNVPHSAPEAREIDLPSFNIKIEFVGIADILDGDYEYYDASKIITDLRYGIYDKDELDEIEKQLKKCLSIFGSIYGFINDPYVARMAHMTTSPSGLTRGEMRINNGGSEMWDGTKWISIKP